MADYRMRSPGAHLRPSAATTNPFADQLPRVNEYTAVEIASLQSKLDKQLGPEYISTRPGAGGGRVHYLAAEKVINLANEVFGFNGWSSEVKQCDIDFVRLLLPFVLLFWAYRQRRWMSIPRPGRYRLDWPLL